MTLPFVKEDVPLKLFVDLEFKKDPKQNKEANACLRLKAKALVNKKYRDLSKYMYIFG